MSHARRDEAEDERDIQNDLDPRDGETDRVAHDQTEKQPVEHAVESPGDGRERGEEKRIKHAHDEDEPLPPDQRESARFQEEDRERNVQCQIDAKELFDDVLGNLLRGERFVVPRREVEIINEDGQVDRLDQQNNVALDRLEPEKMSRRIRGGRTKQFPEKLEGLPGEPHGWNSFSRPWARSTRRAHAPEFVPAERAAPRPRSRRRAVPRPGRRIPRRAP